MQIRRSHVTIAVIASLLVSATVFVQRQWARNQEQTSTAQAKQSSDQGSAASISANARLLNNPDGVEFERTLVTDAPFSATMIIETSERQPDGSLKTKSSTSLIYRDSKGRTRRDWLPDSVTSAKPTRSTITDPVAEFTYNLDHHAASAQRRVLVQPLKKDPVSETARKQAAGRNQMLPVPSTMRTGNSFQPATTNNNAPANQPESLGSRTIEGIMAEGSRLKVTLPPGTINNESPIEITAERWYAPGLQTVVLVNRTDSRTGETTYRLTDINRSEPAAALFTVPPNYKLTDQTGKEIMKSRKTP